MSKLFNFKPANKNRYDLYIGEMPFGLSFEIPDGYNIDDYNFDFIHTGNIEACSEAVFMLDEPSKMGKIEIQSNAGIHFKMGLKVKVQGDLRLAENHRIEMGAYTKTFPSFDNLTIEGNDSTTINFVERTRDHSSMLDKLNKLGEYEFKPNEIKGNRNLIFSVPVNTKTLYLDDNRLMNTSKSKKVQLSTGEAGYIHLKNIILEEVTGDKRKSTSFLEIDSDVINLENCYISAEGSNSLKMKPNESEATRIDDKTGAMIHFQSGNLEVDGLILSFGRNASLMTPSLLIQGNNFISIKRFVLFESTTKLDYASIKSPLKSISFSGESNSITNTEIVFSKNDENSRNQIKNFIAHESNLDGVVGTLSGLVRNTEGKDIVLGENSGLTISPSNSYLHNVKAFISSLKIENDCELILEATDNDKKVIKLDTVNVENGINHIIFTHDATFSNSSFSQAKLVIKNEQGDSFKADNSVFKNEIHLKNISSLSYSEINNSTLDSDVAIEVKDEWLKDRAIFNYKKFLDGKKIKEAALADSNQNKRVLEEMEFL